MDLVLFRRLKGFGFFLFPPTPLLLLLLLLLLLPLFEESVASVTEAIEMSDLEGPPTGLRVSDLSTPETVRYCC